MRKCRLTVVIVLLLTMLATCMTGCNNDTTQSQADSSAAQSSEDTSSTVSEEEKELFWNLPDKDYNDEEFVFLVEGDWQNTYKSVEIMPHEASPELISDAVSERNNLVEEKFGVKIREVRTTATETFDTLIRNNHVGGEDLYDVVCPYIPTAAKLALESYFYDMTDYPELLHLSESYWDQTAVSDMSIKDHVYFCTGDFSLLSLGCTHALVFNKDIVANNSELENPYQLVKDGTWTLDALYRMGKAVTGDTDGVAGMTSDDTYGFILNQNFPTSMFLGSGERLTRKNSDDIPVISIRTDRAASVVTKVFDVVNDTSCSHSIEGFSADVSKRGKTDVWQLATAMVAEGNCLFRAMSIIDIPDLGEYKCNFGILPIPKFSEDQDYYSSNVSVILASCAAIPVANTNPERAAVILEAICQASTDTTRYSYYEVLLKSRKIQDTESEEMLEYIFGNRVYDLGIVYEWGGINNVLNTIVWSGSNTYTSQIDGIIDSVQTALDKTKEYMK